MNSIRIRSGAREIEIASEQACSPKELVEAAREALQMTSQDTAMIEATRVPELPEIINENRNIVPIEAKVVKSEKKKAYGSGDRAQAKRIVGELIAEGKFDNTELSLNDVGTILRGMTYNLEESAVNKALRHYVREKQLVRAGTARKYKYSRRTEPAKNLASQSNTATEDAITATQVDPLIAS